MVLLKGMRNLKRIGELGREKNTGISTSPDTTEKNGMIWKKGNISQAGAGGKETPVNKS
jgi:hypothetical protein